MAATTKTSYNCVVNCRILPVTMNRSLIVYLRGATMYTFRNTFLTTVNLKPTSAIELTPSTILESSRGSWELFLWQQLLNMNVDPHLCDLAAPQIVSAAINAAAAAGRGLGFQLEATLICEVNLNDSLTIRTPSTFFSYASNNLDVEEEGVLVPDDEGTGQMGLGPEPRGVSEEGVLVLDDEGSGHMGLRPEPRGVFENAVP